MSRTVAYQITTTRRDIESTQGIAGWRVRRSCPVAAGLNHCAWLKRLAFKFVAQDEVAVHPALSVGSVMKA